MTLRYHVSFSSTCSALPDGVGSALAWSQVQIFLLYCAGWTHQPCLSLCVYLIECLLLPSIRQLLVKIYRRLLLPHLSDINIIRHQSGLVLPLSQYQVDFSTSHVALSAVWRIVDSGLNMSTELRQVIVWVIEMLLGGFVIRKNRYPRMRCCM